MEPSARKASRARRRQTGAPGRQAGRAAGRASDGAGAGADAVRRNGDEDASGRSSGREGAAARRFGPLLPIPDGLSAGGCRTGPGMRITSCHDLLRSVIDTAPVDERCFAHLVPAHPPSRSVLRPGPPRPASAPTADVRNSLAALVDDGEDAESMVTILLYLLSESEAGHALERRRRRILAAWKRLSVDEARLPSSGRLRRLGPRPVREQPVVKPRIAPGWARRAHRVQRGSCGEPSSVRRSAPKGRAGLRFGVVVEVLPGEAEELSRKIERRSFLTSICRRPPIPACHERAGRDPEPPSGEAPHSRNQGESTLTRCSPIRTTGGETINRPRESGASPVASESVR